MTLPTVSGTNNSARQISRDAWNDVIEAINGFYASLVSTPNYVGDEADSTFIVAQGSSSSPSTTQGAALVIQKTSSATAFNAFAALAVKKATAANSRATAFYSEAADAVGGSDSFSEGYRGQATLTGGSGASGYGGISVAAAAVGTISFKYLVGHESEVDNQIGPDAPAFTSFNKDNFSAGYLATNGNGPVTLYKADGAFVANPYSMKPFRTGLLFPQNSIDHTGIAFGSGLSIVNGIDMSAATISGFAFKSPNFSISGAGAVSFGTWTSNADAAVNGYVTITDAAGNTRKLATIA